MRQTMRRLCRVWIVCACSAAVVLTPGALLPLVSAHPAGTPLAGWYGAFTELRGYVRTFAAPTVDGEQPRAYRQTAHYEWTGNADRRWDATLARDPASRGCGGCAAWARLIARPRIVHLGRYRGWLWDLQATTAGDRHAVRIRLVVWLGTERALILEGRGLGPLDDPRSLVSGFDLARCAAALLGPPRTDSTRSLQPFYALRRGDSYADVAAWVGEADQDIGSGIHILVYHLREGSQVQLGFPDFAHLLYARLVRQDGSVADLTG